MALNSYAFYAFEKMVRGITMVQMHTEHITVLDTFALYVLEYSTILCCKPCSSMLYMTCVCISSRKTNSQCKKSKCNMLTFVLESMHKRDQLSQHIKNLCNFLLIADGFWPIFFLSKRDGSPIHHFQKWFYSKHYFQKYKWG